MLLLTLVLSFSLDFRGIWVPRWSIDDHENIFATLDNRFNHVFLQVFALGEAYYPSENTVVKRYDDQWLRDFLTEAHRRNIKVSAWLNVFYSWGYADRTRDMRHPINRHPNWYAEDRTGTSILDYGVEELKHMGIEGYYLTPANNQVFDYIMEVATELLEKYEFDGVHLDYCRYPSRRFIYDVSLRSKFMREYSVDPTDFGSPEFEQRFSIWGSADLDNRMQKVVRDDLTRFVGALSARVKRSRPYIEVSVAVKADYQSAAADFYQDWPLWLNTGLVDYVCLMAYGNDIGGILDKAMRIVDDPQKVAVGLGVYRLNTDRIAAQVRQVASLPFSGVVFFSYEELRKNRGYLGVFP
ncbi:MAG: family 10 glycosylhydrolase [candidate division WOR-3 bacterium]|nr:family 10 glycosylhydrolase [candidate division WOR-3 bacterium]